MTAFASQQVHSQLIADFWSRKIVVVVGAEVFLQAFEPIGIASQVLPDDSKHQESFDICEGPIVGDTVEPNNLSHKMRATGTSSPTNPYQDINCRIVSFIRSDITLCLLG